MEPTNHPFRKENDLPNLHDYVPAVNLPGCKFLVETGSWIKQGTIASPRDADACRLVKLASLASVVCPETPPPRKNPEMVKEVLNIFKILVDFGGFLVDFG